MAIFVSADWVQEHLSSPDILLLDPRSSMKYLQGHIRNAVNLPIRKAFDSQGELIEIDALRSWLGTAGITVDKTLVVYDSYDGQQAAMLTWILEYLGCTEVKLLDVFLERWVAEGREVFYRPVIAQAAEFEARVNPELRITTSELLARSQLVEAHSQAPLVDFRSRDEYLGKQQTDERPGHLPGAINLPWLDLLGEDQQFIAPKERLQQLFANVGLGHSDEVVAYCRMGMRAAIGYLALQQLGRRVRLYDGSYAQWARSGLPVERPVVE